MRGKRREQTTRFLAFARTIDSTPSFARQRAAMKKAASNRKSYDSGWCWWTPVPQYAKLKMNSTETTRSAVSKTNNCISTAAKKVSAAALIRSGHS